MTQTFAIDFDNTFTANPVLWSAFIYHARQTHNRVICVTGRDNTVENRETVEGYFAQHGIGDIPVFYTGQAAKVWYMEQAGVKVDVWIDDSPETLIHAR